MANISTYLAAILSAVYGEDVRGSIHDAIEIINEVGEVVFSTGTDVTSASSSSTGYFEKSLYLNTDTYELWKCIGTDTWQSLGILKGDAGVGISSIQKTSTAGLVDTYTITYTDGNSDTFTVTNGADGADGNHIYRGTGISGKAVAPTVYSGSGIAKANKDDLYLNPSEGAIYSCVTGGDASTATWQYEFTMTGGGGSSYSAGTGINISSSDVISVDPGTIASGENKPPKAGDVYDELVKKVDIDQGVAHAGEYMKVGPDGKLAPAAGEGGGMLPYLYIDSEAGATVTVNQPDGTTITPTAAGSGHWECELTGGYGTYVIHSVLSGQGDATLSLAVDTVKEYHVTDTHYDYTINVTAPSGSSIRITGGGETYTGTGTGTSQAFAVHTPSTVYTITATQIMDGNTKTDEATVTSDATSGGSTNVTLSIEFGTINVSVAADFVTAGSTITCVNGGTSCTPKTAASTLTFRVPTTGTWTISGEISGQTYSVDAVVTSLSTAVNVNLQTVPEGSTVLPTDDIQIWLNCAGIYNKTSYTTLVDVLADSTTLLALMSDNNAVDYLVRSKKWITGKGLVPQMIDDTHPSGVASASSTYDGTTPAWKAFNRNTSDWWNSATSGLPAWVSYEFDTPKTVARAGVVNINSNYGAGTVYIEASSDGTTWTKVSEDVVLSNANLNEQFINITDNSAYKYWRLYITNTKGATSVAIVELQFYPLDGDGITDDSTAMTDIGANNYAADTLLEDEDWCEAIANSVYIASVLNVSVPTMTSNTAPSGQCINSSNDGTNWYPYKAFDKNNDTYWSATERTNQWLGYIFANNVKVKAFKVRHKTDSAGLFGLKNFRIEKSLDNGTTWTNIYTGTMNSDEMVGAISANEDSTTHYRLYAIDNTHSSHIWVAELDFYGREDV